jgi:hypothetical protein
MSTDARYIIELTGTRKSEYKGLNYISGVTYGEVMFEIHPTTKRCDAFQWNDLADVVDMVQSLILNGHKAKLITLGTTTDSPIRQQYTKNLEQMRGMLERARKVAPKKFLGYTVEKLEESVARFENIVAMDDAELSAHLSKMFGTLTTGADHAAR